jgi:hypothetical protein
LLFFVRRPTVWLQQSQKAGKFLRRLSTNGLDHVQSLRRTFGIGIYDPASAGCVQHHHRNGVGDDIVQFGSDVGAFLRYGRFSFAPLFFQRADAETVSRHKTAEGPRPSQPHGSGTDEPQILIKGPAA